MRSVRFVAFRGLKTFAGCSEQVVYARRVGPRRCCAARTHRASGVRAESALGLATRRSVLPPEWPTARWVP